MSNKRIYIGAPLRRGLDDDLTEAISKLGNDSKAELVRQGLRMVLGIESHKVIEVHERPVPSPKIFLNRRAKP